MSGEMPEGMSGYRLGMAHGKSGHPTLGIHRQRFAISLCTELSVSNYRRSFDGDESVLLIIDCQMDRIRSSCSSCGFLANSAVNVCRRPSIVTADCYKTTTQEISPMSFLWLHLS